MKIRQFLTFPLRAVAVVLALTAAGLGGVCPCCGQAVCPTGGAFATLSSALGLLFAMISMRRNPWQEKDGKPK